MKKCLCIFLLALMPAQTLLAQTPSYLACTGSGHSRVCTGNVNTVLNPMVFGAAGNGSSDDTAALQAMRSSCAAGPCSMMLPGKTFAVNSGIFDVGGTSSTAAPYASLVGVGRASQITCSPSTTQEACVRVYNGSQSTIQNLRVTCNPNVTYCVEYISTGSAETADLSNVEVSGGQYGVAISPTQHWDIAHVTLSNVKIENAVLADLVDGDGVQSNVLDEQCFGCTFDTSQNDGVLIRGGGWRCFGCDYDANANIDVEVTTLPDQVLLLSGGRSEISKEFLKVVPGWNVSIPAVIIDGVSWHSTSNNANVIEVNDSSSVSIRDSNFISTDASHPVQFSFGGVLLPNPQSVTMQNVGTSNHNWGALLQTMAANPTVNLDSVGDYYIDPTDFHISAGTGRHFSTSPVFGAPFVVDSEGDLSTTGSISNLAGGFGAYENLVLYSQFENASLGVNWTNQCASPNPATMTANTTDLIDPYGAHTALKFVSQSVADPSCGGAVASTLQQDVTLTVGHTYLTSFYVRGAVGGEAFSYGNDISGVFPGADADTSSNPITTAWKRYTFQYTVPAGWTGTGFAMGINPGETIYFWGAQIVDLSEAGLLYAHSTGSGVPPTLGYLVRGTPILGQIPSIQITTGTTAVPANTCTSYTAAAMPGVIGTTAFLDPTPTTATSGVTGWGSSGGLGFSFYPTADTYNWAVCNPTANPITPGASLTWNVAGR